MRERITFQKGFIAVIVSLFIISAFFITSSICSLSAKANEIAPSYKYYTSIPVEKGDTLWDIANEYMGTEYTSVESYISEIRSLNHLVEDDIYAGEYLTIPYYSAEIL